MRKPNLFLIGGAKCGTTSMASYLGGHPAIFWSEPKELWYFCRPDFPHKSSQPIELEEYLGHFSGSGSQHKYLAEGSVSYLYSEGAVQRIVEFNPSSKFIVMLRNPLEAVVSLHRQMLLNMQESEADFGTAWKLQTARRQGKNIPMKCENSAYLMYRGWCLWGEQLERVFRTAGRENVCVLLFDDFKRNSAAEYERVLSFLGLEPDNRSEFPVENRGRAYRNQKLINAVDSFLVAGSRIRRKLNLSSSMGFLSRPLRSLKRGQLREAGHAKLSQALAAELKMAFRSDIELLSNLLQRDLSYWLDYGE